VRYLILSDIHANWEALETVLDHAAGSYDEIVCCGDLVGYGADPNRVVEWARGNAKLVVRGNHDKACAGLDDLEWFNPIARMAALWTGEALAAENLDYLRALPQGPIELESFQVLHGSPLDEDDYLVSVHSVAQICGYLNKDLSFFGHTHLQGGFLCHRNGVKRLARPPRGFESAGVELDPNAAYLVNPGSVGQPRDGDPRAAYIVYDPGERYVEFRRVAYDVRKAQAKILKAGLPDLLAERLDTGN
jgi:predicted phosphodiesterase